MKFKKDINTLMLVLSIVIGVPINYLIYTKFGGTGILVFMIALSCLVALFPKIFYK